MTEHRIMDQTVREAGLRDSVDKGQEDWILMAKAEDAILWDRTALEVIAHGLKSNYPGSSTSFTEGGEFFIAIDPQQISAIVNVEHDLRQMADGQHPGVELYQACIREELDAIWDTIDLSQRIDFTQMANLNINEALKDFPCAEILDLLKYTFDTG